VLDTFIHQIEVAAAQRRLGGFFVFTGDRAVPDLDQERRSCIQARALDYMQRTQGTQDASEETLTGDGEGRGLKIVKMPIAYEGLAVSYSPIAVRWEPQVLRELNGAILDRIERKAMVAQKRDGSHILVLVNMNHFAERKHYQRIMAGLQDVQRLGVFHAIFLCVRSGCFPLRPQKEPNEGWPAFFRTQRPDLAPNED
jgi:hypothetical protein